MWLSKTPFHLLTQQLLKQFFFLVRSIGLTIIMVSLTTSCKTLEISELTQAATNLAQEQGFISRDQAQSINRSTAAATKAMEEITPRQEYYIGRAVTAQLLQQFPAHPNKALNLYVNQLGQSLASFSARPQTFKGYHFLVLRSDIANAFAAPGGFILITSGMIKRCESEDALAAVLAHEITHAALQHGLKSIKQQRLNDALAVLADEAVNYAGNQQLLELTKAFDGMVSELAFELVNKGYSRDLEIEADHGSGAMLKTVGYALTPYQTLLSGLPKQSAGTGFFRSHPHHQERLNTIKDLAQGFHPKPSNTARAKRFANAIALL